MDYEFKVGDKVLIEDISNKYWTDFGGRMAKYSFKIMTIRSLEISSVGKSYRMEEDINDHYGEGWFWKADDCIYKKIEV